MKKMLENNSTFFADAHFHYSCCLSDGCFNPPLNWKGCSCAHSIEEWEIQKKSIGDKKIVPAFGLHPQGNYTTEIEFLKTLLEKNEVQAIGEAGFDFFTGEFKAKKNEQENNFILQAELAAYYKKPLIIHCRKANEKLFEHSSLLKKIPSVLFHSFMGSFVEAQSLYKRGINAYFSFGKQVMNNNKKVVECVQKLPLEKLLLETDAPFQFLKGEQRTYISDIKNIYDAVKDLLKLDYDMLLNVLSNNFDSLFNFF
ncbi:MAG: TatD family hydrolase [Treponema sp.]|nr:TatD family hydrolase [Treponema sp.]